MPQKLKSIVIGLLKVAFACGLLYWLYTKEFLDFKTIKKIINFEVICIGMALVVIHVFMNNLRWTMLLRGQAFAVQLKETMRLTLIGLFFNFAMPGGVGGDVIKGYYLVKLESERKIAAAMSIVMDRVVGIYTMVLLAVFALLSNYSFTMGHMDLKFLFFTLLTIAVSVFILFQMAFSERVFNKIENLKYLDKLPGSNILKGLLEAIHSYKDCKHVIVKCIGVSVMSQFTLITMFIYLVVKLGLDLIPWFNMFWMVPVGMISSSIPISPGGVGVGQAAYSYIFNVYIEEKYRFHENAAEIITSAKPLGATLITTYQAALFVLGLLGLYFYLRQKKPNETINT